MRFDKWLNEQIQKSGKTYVQLSKETGIMRSTLSAYSLGERVPNIDKASQIAGLFGYELVLRKKEVAR